MSSALSRPPSCFAVAPLSFPFSPSLQVHSPLFFFPAAKPTGHRTMRVVVVVVVVGGLL